MFSLWRVLVLFCIPHLNFCSLSSTYLPEWSSMFVQSAFTMWPVIMWLFVPSSKLIYSRYKWYMRAQKVLQQVNCSCRTVPHVSVLNGYFLFINYVHFNSLESQIMICENSIIMLWYLCKSSNGIWYAFDLSSYSLHLSLIPIVTLFFSLGSLWLTGSVGLPACLGQAQALLSFRIDLSVTAVPLFLFRKVFKIASDVLNCPILYWAFSMYSRGWELWQRSCS